MKVIIDMCVIPVGVGISLSPYVAACEKVLSEAGLEIQLHANGTNIEGEWERSVCGHQTLSRSNSWNGCSRIATTSYLGLELIRTRPWKTRSTAYSKLLERMMIFHVRHSNAQNEIMRRLAGQSTLLKVTSRC
jgi:uncharacterized protein (TIGR00106 family)